MKLALFTDTFCDANGVSRFLQDMQRCAHASHRKFHLFTSTLKPHCRGDYECTNPAPLLRMPMPFYPQLDLALPHFGALKASFEDFAPDLVHVSTPGPIGWWGKRLAQKAGIPLVGTYHTDFPHYLYDNLPSRWIEKATYAVMRSFYRDFDRVLTRSSLYRNVLHQRVGVGADRSFVLQAGTDTERFHPRYADLKTWSDFGVPEEGPKILYVGRLSKEKNFAFLLELWQEFRQRYTRQVQWIVVGNGSLQKSVMNRESEGIYYLGHRAGKDLAFLYAASDLFITASETETLGQTILEAMASGTPVVVSARGGQCDFVEDRCGRIVASRKPKVWAEALLELAEDPQLRAHKAAAALRRAETMTIQRSFEDFWRLHQELLGA